jgi:hypothetical protein
MSLAGIGKLDKTQKFGLFLEIKDNRIIFCNKVLDIHETPLVLLRYFLCFQQKRTQGTFPIFADFSKNSNNSKNIISWIVLFTAYNI